MPKQVAVPFKIDWTQAIEAIDRVHNALLREARAAERKAKRKVRIPSDLRAEIETKVINGLRNHPYVGEMCEASYRQGAANAEVKLLQRMVNRAGDDRKLQDFLLAFNFQYNMKPENTDGT